MEVELLDAMGTILAATAIAVVLTGVVTTMPIQLRGRLALATAVGVWVGIAAAVAGAGKLANPATTLIMFTLPLATVTGLALLSPTVRTKLQALPMPLLIGLNLIRVGGALFVLLAVAGRLAGPFPYSAGLGNFLTGALAVPVAWLARNPRRTRIASSRRGMRLAPWT